MRKKPAAIRSGVVLGRISPGIGPIEEITLSGFTTSVSGGAGGGSSISGGGGGGGGDRFSWERASNGVPKVADFTVLNAGTAGTFTQTDGTDNLILWATDDGGNDQHKAISKSIPSETFDFIVKFYSAGTYVNYAKAGIGVRNSTSGRFILFDHDHRSTGGGLGVEKYTNYTTFSASLLVGTNGAPRYNWLRITGDGTTLKFFVSSDGITWAQYISTTFAAFIDAAGGTVDQACVFINPANTTDGQMTINLVHWELS